MPVSKDLQKISKKNPKGRTIKRGRKPSGGSIYRFEEFVIDEAERRLSRGEQQIRLTPKVFDTLMILVKGAGRLITKEVLIDTLWPDSFIEEANLGVNIATLRKALGEHVGENQYIETISKRGYRFVAAVEVIDHEELVRRRSRSTISPQLGVKHLAGRSNFLAILPFENGTPDPNAEYLSDGLTECIISRVSQVRDLRVVARSTVFRYKNRIADPRIVGCELGVSAVLTGRILQLDDKLVIGCELIDVAKGWQLWGEQFHRKTSDILTLQYEISDAISAKLVARFTGKEKRQLRKQHTHSDEAYRLYLKGRYHWNKFDLDNLRKAISYFEAAITIDSNYALAYAGLADSYYRISNAYAPTREAMPKAKAAAVKAVEIDDTLSEVHSALGLIRMCQEWDWSGAQESLRRAIEISPNNALARQRLGLLFNLFGRYEEAMRELELAFDLDPLSPQIYWSFAVSYVLQRKTESGIAETYKTLDLDCNYQPALYLLGRAQIELNEPDEAITTFNRLLGLNDAPMFLAGLGHAHARAGNREEARHILEQLRKRSQQHYVSCFCLALIHLALGENDRAFELLQRAYDDRCEMLGWLKVDPSFDSVQGDPRYLTLLRQLGLADNRALFVPAGSAR